MTRQLSVTLATAMLATLAVASPAAAREAIECTPESSSVPVSECEALAALFAASDQRSFPGWEGATDPCGWGGIGCADGHVTSVTFTRRNLGPTLPAAIADLTELEQLTLSRNGLAVIPPEIGELKKLRVLDLSYNAIGSVESDIAGGLPRAFSGLRSLRRLNLSDNPLGTLPYALRGMRDLTHLQVTNAQIDGMGSATISSLTGLRFLFLQDNDLDGLALGFGQLTSLEYLGIENNNINSLDAVGSLPSIQQIDASFNRLVTLPSFTDTPLVFLFARQNQITHLPHDFGAESLVSLVLGSNPLRRLPNGLPAATPNLSTLSIKGSELAGMPTTVGAWRNMTHLDLRGGALRDGQRQWVAPLHAALDGSTSLNLLLDDGPGGNDCLRVGTGDASAYLRDWMDTVSPGWDVCEGAVGAT